MVKVFVQLLNIKQSGMGSPLSVQVFVDSVAALFPIPSKTVKGDLMKSIGSPVISLIPFSIVKDNWLRFRSVCLIHIPILVASLK
jgi:hypothetical protein